MPTAPLGPRPLSRSVDVDATYVGGKPRRTRAWQKALRQFPDTTIAGRLYRILAWYGIQRVIRRDVPDKELANSLEDAECAFKASYMFEIATEDEGLYTVPLRYCP